MGDEATANAAQRNSKHEQLLYVTSAMIALSVLVPSPFTLPLDPRPVTR